MIGVKQGEVGRGASRPYQLSNLLYIIFIIAFMRTVIFQRGTS